MGGSVKFSGAGAAFALTAMAMTAFPAVSFTANQTASAATVITRTTSERASGVVTTYAWANGEQTQVFDLRSETTVVPAADSHVTSPAGISAINSSGFDIAPDETVDLDKSNFRPVSNLSSSSMIAALGAPAQVVADFGRVDKLNGQESG